MNNDLRLAHYEGRCTGDLGVRKEDGEDRGRISTPESEVKADVARRQSRQYQGFGVVEALGRSAMSSVVALFSNPLSR